MKHIISVFSTVIILLMSIISVFASDSVQFKLSDCTTDNNRLFTVEMTATSSIKLSAVTFEFEYDKNLLEFKSAKTTDNESKITVNENYDNVKIVYLNTYGKNIKNGEVILALTFKSVKSGTGYIDFTVSDCVDSDINNTDIGNCASSKIVVNSKNANSEKNKNEDADENNESENKSKSSRNKEQETTSNASIDELGLLNPLSVNNKKYLITGICIGAVIVLLTGTGFFIGTRVSRKNNNINSKSSDK